MNKRSGNRPRSSHDDRDDGNFVPFETITVHEKEKHPAKPLLYDSAGKPLIHPTDVPRPVGFKVTK
jgi:hypothetical protein